MTGFERLDSADVKALMAADVSEVRERLEGGKFLLTDLKALMDAERVVQDRDEVEQLINQKVTDENIAEYLGVDEEKIEGFARLVDSIDDVVEFKRRGLRREVDREQQIRLVMGNVSDLREYIESNDLSLSQLDQLLAAEERFKDRKTAKKIIKERITGRSLEEYLEEKGISFEELRDRVEKSDSFTLERPSEVEGESIELSDDEESDDAGHDTGKRVSVEELEERILEREREKREDLIDELTELGLAEEELRESTTADLEKLWEQRDDIDRDREEASAEREELVKELRMRGLPKEQVEQSTLSDLRKIKQSLDDVGNGREQTDEGEKSWGDIMQEAKTDLERLRSGNDGAGPAMAAEDVEQLLETYRSLDPEEAAIKTACVVAGYLRDGMNLPPNTTYRDVADELPEEQDEHIARMAGFLRDMYEARYSQHVAVDDVDAVIDTCQYVIDGLEFLEGE